MLRTGFKYLDKSNDVIYIVVVSPKDNVALGVWRTLDGTMDSTWFQRDTEMIEIGHFEEGYHGNTTEQITPLYSTDIQTAIPA